MSVFRKITAILLWPIKTPFMFWAGTLRPAQIQKAAHNARPDIEDYLPGDDSEPVQKTLPLKVSLYAVAGITLIGIGSYNLSTLGTYIAWFSGITFIMLGVLICFLSYATYWMAISKKRLPVWLSKTSLYVARKGLKALPPRVGHRTRRTSVQLREEQFIKLLDNAEKR